MKIGEAHRTVWSAFFQNHKVHIFIEYHSLCPLVGIGSNCAPPLPPGRGGGHSCLRVRGWGSLNCDDWRKAWHSSYSVCETIGPPIAMARGHRSANILAHRCSPPPIGNADQTLCANNFFFSCLVRHYYWRRVHPCAISIGGL